MNATIFTDLEKSQEAFNKRLKDIESEKDKLEAAIGQAKAEHEAKLRKALEVALTEAGKIYRMMPVELRIALDKDPAFEETLKPLGLSRRHAATAPRKARTPRPDTGGGGRKGVSEQDVLDAMEAGKRYQQQEVADLVGITSPAVQPKLNRLLMNGQRVEREKVKGQRGVIWWKK